MARCGRKVWLMRVGRVKLFAFVVCSTRPSPMRLERDAELIAAGEDALHQSAVETVVARRHWSMSGEDVC